MRLLQALLFFLLIFIINTCTSLDNSPPVYPEGWNATDTTNVESFPRYFTLRVGDRLWVKNAGVIISFCAVYEESYDSHQILVSYYYVNGFYDEFYFNSDELPRSYELKTDAHHTTIFNALNYSDDNWLLDMEYNKYAYL